MAGLDEELQAQAQQFAEVNTSDTEELLKPGVADAITALWASDAVKAVWERRNEIQVTEVHTQFVERVAEIASPDYQANFQVSDSMKSTDLVSRSWDRRGFGTLGSRHRHRHAGA